MLLEIVVENGTQGHQEEEGEDEGGEDDGDDADDEDGDDDDDDEDDECSDSEIDDDEMEIGGERGQALVKSEDGEFHSKVPVSPWIEEDDDVSDCRVFSANVLACTNNLLQSIPSLLHS